MLLGRTQRTRDAIGFGDNTAKGKKKWFGVRRDARIPVACYCAYIGCCFVVAALAGCPGEVPRIIREAAVQWVYLAESDWGVEGGRGGKTGQ